ncbi:MAG: hypothetical protein MUF52_05325 [Syntrophobacteraceae bacterium]|nr:hypothetical protein [Syntrophobacteraceae bacterium]
MSRDWFLEVQPSLDAVLTLRLTLRGEKGGEGGTLAASCGSVDELREEVARMKSELDGAMDKALAEVEAFQKAGGGSRVADPSQVWKEMEGLPNEGEMFSHFNEFSLADRQVIAEYILSHVNMFKGRGPVFSEHYDSDTHRLE